MGPTNVFERVELLHKQALINNRGIQGAFALKYNSNSIQGVWTKLQMLRRSNRTMTYECVAGGSQSGYCLCSSHQLGDSAHKCKLLATTSIVNFSLITGCNSNGSWDDREPNFVPSQASKDLQ